IISSSLSFHDVLPTPCSPHFPYTTLFRSNPDTPPPAPQNVVSISGNAQVRLSWEKVSGATTYNIYWSTTAGAVKKTGTKISAARSEEHTSELQSREKLVSRLLLDKKNEKN